jgi:endonuclease YncB( thermonuclease family)
MSPRSAATAFVASLVLVVVSLGAWVTSRGQGVGTDLEQVTLAASSVAGGSGDSGDPSPGGASMPAQTPTAPRFADVPVVDATTIEVPDEVQPPRRVRIASVDISMPVTATGVTRDGQMELPDDPRTIGWYRFGALPGEARGSAVLGGHVDSKRYGTGPLARLASVRDGDLITVTAADGQRIRYQVTSVERITKAALPVDRLFDPDVAHRLVIVTCGGRYLPDAGGYEDNIVVIATPAS